MSLTVSPISSERKEGKFDLFEEIVKTLDKNKFRIENGDILVISSKYISNSQGRLLDMKNVQASEDGSAIANKFQIIPQIAEVILRESDVVFGGISGFVITSSDNILAPNSIPEVSLAGATFCGEYGFATRGSNSETSYSYVLE